ncbi:hypothetical protein, partial [Psittacicella hinzii]|uniref:hypothetical protein n=1 Tax=Psittacicella hinzii TaxID=2028575 RepID=UPI00361246DA
ATIAAANNVTLVGSNVTADNGVASATGINVTLDNSNISANVINQTSTDANGSIIATNTRLTADSINLDTESNTIVFDASVAGAPIITVYDTTEPKIVNSTNPATYPRRDYKLIVTEKVELPKPAVDLLSDEATLVDEDVEEKVDSTKSTQGYIFKAFFKDETTNDVERSVGLLSGSISVSADDVTETIDDHSSNQSENDINANNFTSSTFKVVSNSGKSPLNTCFETLQPVLNKYHVTKEDQLTLSPKQIIAKYGMTPGDAKLFTNNCQKIDNIEQQASPLLRK